MFITEVNVLRLVKDAQRVVSEDPPIGRPEFPADCPIFIIFTALLSENE
jgi:hypothetical protein